MIRDGTLLDVHAAMADVRESLILYFRDPVPPLHEILGGGERTTDVKRRFAESPEGAALGEVRFVEIFLEHAQLYYDADETSLTPEMVREIVFELIPRHVTVPASEASRIIFELRLFLVYLARSLGENRYFACAHALDGRADEQLERRLADPGCFGVLKSAVMAGLDDGYDINTVEGLQAWFARLDARERGAAHSADDRARRAQRKARRRARRRNRRSG